MTGRLACGSLRQQGWLGRCAWLKSVASTSSTAALVAAVAVGGAACGNVDDGLGKGFKERAGAPVEGPETSPIKPGTELWYTLKATLRRQSNGGGGMLQNEAQSGGDLCIRVDSVTDPATAGDPAITETKIHTVMRATELKASDGMHGGDASDEASNQAIDALLSPLWLKGMTLPSGANPFTRPARQTFDTQSVPGPQATLAALPFFETRQMAKVKWSGWAAVTTMPNAGNYLNKLYDVFLSSPEYGLDFFGKMQRRSVTPPASCEDFTDAMSCQRNSCTWSVAPGANMSSCLQLYTIRLLWRDTLSAPEELAGAVIRQLEMAYDASGILVAASELIVPDQWVGQPVPAVVNDCGERCLAANVNNMGTFPAASNDPDNPSCAF